MRWGAACITVSATIRMRLRGLNAPFLVPDSEKTPNALENSILAPCVNRNNMLRRECVNERNLLLFCKETGINI